jgi:hypothetical protein
VICVSGYDTMRVSECSLRFLERNIVLHPVFGILVCVPFEFHRNYRQMLPRTHKKSHIFVWIFEVQPFEQELELELVTDSLARSRERAGERAKTSMATNVAMARKASRPPDRRGP